MWNNSDAAVAAAHSVDPDRWWTAYSAVLDRVESRFGRYEPLRHAGALMLGMLSGLDHKNCWTIAEQRGELSPDGLQHLLARAKWDADEVRDDLRGCVTDAFGEPDAVLVIDETGDLKKGEHSVGAIADGRRGQALQFSSAHDPWCGPSRPPSPPSPGALVCAVRRATPHRGRPAVNPSVAGHDSCYAPWTPHSC